MTSIASTIAQCQLNNHCKSTLLGVTAILAHLNNHRPSHRLLYRTQSSQPQTTYPLPFLFGITFPYL